MPRPTQGIHTILRDKDCSREDFIHFSTRLSTIIVEEALKMLPYSAQSVTTPTGCDYDGKKLDISVRGVCAPDSLLSI